MGTSLGGSPTALSPDLAVAWIESIGLRKFCDKDPEPVRWAPGAIMERACGGAIAENGKPPHDHV
jgi:hypothetical protein